MDDDIIPLKKYEKDLKNMDLPKHQRRSLEIMHHLDRLGLNSDVQQRLGTFGLLWGIFETNLELALWALHDEKVTGVQPSTDKTSICNWIKAFANGSEKLTPEAKDVLNLASNAADDLKDYRNSIVHGYIFPAQTISTFCRNPTWHGEIRKRKSGEAHVDENLLDMAIDAAWVLCRVVSAVKSACEDTIQTGSLLDLKSEVLRAKGQAYELRHLSELVNDETY